MKADRSFIPNHGFVLLAIARNPEIRLREVAREVGITERAVQRIVADLEARPFLVRVNGTTDTSRRRRQPRGRTRVPSSVSMTSSPRSTSSRRMASDVA